MHDLHVTRVTRWPWSVWPLPMYSRPFLGNLSNSTLIAASRAAWRPKNDEKRACLIHLILCFVNLLFFCCGKKGTWLEHGRIFSIKKIILQLDLFSSVVVDVTQMKSYLYTSTILLLCQLSKAMFEAFSHSHPQNEQRHTSGGPWLVQYRSFTIPTGESSWKRFEQPTNINFEAWFFMSTQHLKIHNCGHFLTLV